MKSKFYIVSSVFLLLTLVYSCKKKEDIISKTNSTISTSVLESIKKLGFSTVNVQAFNDGYIVEGDIFISKESLNKVVKSPVLNIVTEQYRTNNLVMSVPRTITIYVDNNLSTNFIDATDIAISRYNNLHLNITFQRIMTSADINIIGHSWPINPGGGTTLGSSGFPENGNPYNQILLNSDYYTSSFNVNYLASTLQHEIGHTIGLRHTDYFDRGSCMYNDGNNHNEGGDYDSNDIQHFPGAINIPGTPTGTDSGSFMLACSDNTDRNFNNNDVVALNYLYGSKIQLPVSRMSIGGDGVIYAISANQADAGGNGIYYWSTNVWQRLNGAGLAISVNNSGIPWVVNALNGVFRRDGYYWTQVSGTATDIGIGANGSMYIIGNDWADNGGYHIYQWINNSWVQLNGAAVRIVVGPNGTPWVLNASGNIFRRDGNAWTQIPGIARDIAIGGDGSVYLIGNVAADFNGYQIYKLVNNSFVLINGSATNIAVGPNGTAWVVNSQGNLYRRDGNSWTPINSSPIY